MLTPILAKVRWLSGCAQAPRARQSPLQSLSSTGDSGGPLIVHKRSRFIQVSVRFVVCGGDAQGQHEPQKGECDARGW